MRKLIALALLVGLIGVALVTLGGSSASAWCPPAPGEVGNCPTTTTEAPPTTTVPPTTTTVPAPPPKVVQPPPPRPVVVHPRTTG